MATCALPSTSGARGLTRARAKPSHRPSSSARSCARCGAGEGTGRRTAALVAAAGLLLPAPARRASAAAPVVREEPNAENTPLIAELLERSKANKEKYDKERLDEYYRKNYEDYFKLTEGGRGRSRRQATQEQDKEVEELLARWRAEDKAKSEADWARLKEQLKERLGRSE